MTAETAITVQVRTFRMSITLAFNVAGGGTIPREADAQQG
jgi:hypothetical protein